VEVLPLLDATIFRRAQFRKADQRIWHDFRRNSSLRWAGD